MDNFVNVFESLVVFQGVRFSRQSPANMARPGAAGIFLGAKKRAYGKYRTTRWRVVMAQKPRL